MSFVWVKLSTAKEDVFAKVTITASDLVTDVAELSCAKFARWRLCAGQVRIHLVAESGEEPSDEAIGAALAKKHLPVNAVVTSGAWLVVVPITPVGGGGSGRSGEVASSTGSTGSTGSISPYSISVSSTFNRSHEEGEIEAYWTLARANLAQLTQLAQQLAHELQQQQQLQCAQRQQLAQPQQLQFERTGKGCCSLM
jgi:hypothetical protein